MTDLAGKVVMITGGATGIGFATARTLLERSASVVLTGHDPSQVEDAASNLASYSGLRTATADVRQLDALDSAVKLAESEFGHLDGLVCAAGIQIPGTAVSASEDDWNRILDVNLSGAFRACKSAIPAIERAGGGAVILVSSVQALRGKANGVAYVATKGGLNAMCRAMAMDHAPANIRVNAVCPGVVDTPLVREAAGRAGAVADMDAAIRKWSEAQPLTAAIDRVCQPEDVAALIAFLLSDDAAYITGGEFNVDGGLAAKLAL